jgi:hypothetical protein
MHPGAEIASLTRYGAEPIDESLSSAVTSI